MYCPAGLSQQKYSLDTCGLKYGLNVETRGSRREVIHFRL